MTKENAIEKKATQRKISIEEKFFMILRLDKSRRRWRLLAVLLILLVGGAILYFMQKDPTKEILPKSSYIAEIKISGIITGDDYRSKQLEKIKDNDKIKAVILTIDSPGGSMVPALELLDQLKLIAKEKPLVVQMKTVAASAGYLISLSGDYVVANQATLTGSIGVLMPLVDARELAEKIGVKSVEVSSGELKDITSPLADRTEKAHEYLQSVVLDLKQIFMNEVKNKRNISAKVEQTMSDGRFIIGKKAYEYNLIDALGSKKDVLNYLYKEKNISKKLKVVEIPLVEEESDLGGLLTSKLVSQIVSELKNVIFNSSFYYSTF